MRGLAPTCGVLAALVLGLAGVARADEEHIGECKGADPERAEGVTPGAGFDARRGRLCEGALSGAVVTGTAREAGAIQVFGRLVEGRRDVLEARDIDPALALARFALDPASLPAGGRADGLTWTIGAEQVLRDESLEGGELSAAATPLAATSPALFVERYGPEVVRRVVRGRRIAVVCALPFSEGERTAEQRGALRSVIQAALSRGDAAPGPEAAALARMLAGRGVDVSVVGRVDRAEDDRALFQVARDSPWDVAAVRRAAREAVERSTSAGTARPLRWFVRPYAGLPRLTREPDPVALSDALERAARLRSEIAQIEEIEGDAAPSWSLATTLRSAKQARRDALRDLAAATGAYLAAAPGSPEEGATAKRLADEQARRLAPIPDARTGGASAPLSADAKHRLYQAAAMTGDSMFVLRVNKVIGIMREDGMPTDDMMKFTSEHGAWAMGNVGFIQSMNSPDKAREYVRTHLR